MMHLPDTRATVEVAVRVTFVGLDKVDLPSIPKTYIKYNRKSVLVQSVTFSYIYRPEASLYVMAGGAGLYMKMDGSVGRKDAALYSIYLTDLPKWLTDEADYRAQVKFDLLSDQLVNLKTASRNLS